MVFEAINHLSVLDMISRQEKDNIGSDIMLEIEEALTKSLEFEAGIGKVGINLQVLMNDAKKIDEICQTMAPHEAGSPDMYWRRVVDDNSDLFFSKLGIEDEALFRQCCEGFVAVTDLFEAFCAACEETRALYEQRSELERWLGLDNSPGDSDLQCKLQSIAYAKFADFCTRVYASNPDALVCAGVAHFPGITDRSEDDDFQAALGAIEPETSEESDLKKVLRLSLLDFNPPRETDGSKEDVDVQEAIRQSLQSLEKDPS